MFKFWGKVRRGFNRGQGLGFPTANLNLTKSIAEGIYLAKTKIDKQDFPSLVFIGSAKTFKASVYQAEVYILNFNQNLYNKWISVTLIEKIRDNQKFDTVEDLVSQMQMDLKKAQEYFHV